MNIKKIFFVLLSAASFLTSSAMNKKFARPKCPEAALKTIALVKSGETVATINAYKFLNTSKIRLAALTKSANSAIDVSAYAQESIKFFANTIDRIENLQKPIHADRSDSIERLENDLLSAPQKAIDTYSIALTYKIDSLLRICAPLIPQCIAQSPALFNGTLAPAKPCDNLLGSLKRAKKYKSLCLHPAIKTKLSGTILDTKWSKNGNYLAACSKAGDTEGDTLSIFDTATTEKVRTVALPEIRRSLICPNDKLLVVLAKSCSIIHLALPGLPCIKKIPAECYNANFSKNSDAVALWSKTLQGQHRLDIYNLKNNTILSYSVPDHCSDGINGCFNADATNYYLPAEKGIYQVDQTTRALTLIPYKNRTNNPYSILSLTGGSLFALVDRNSIEVFNNAYKQSNKITFPENTGINSVCVCPQERSIVVMECNRRANIIDVDSLDMQPKTIFDQFNTEGGTVSFHGFNAEGTVALFITSEKTQDSLYTFRPVLYDIAQKNITTLAESQTHNPPWHYHGFLSTNSNYVALSDKQARHGMLYDLTTQPATASLWENTDEIQISPDEKIIIKQNKNSIAANIFGLEKVSTEQALALTTLTELIALGKITALKPESWILDAINKFPNNHKDHLYAKFKLNELCTLPTTALNT